MKKILMMILAILGGLYGFSFPEYGIQDNSPSFYALINADIISEPGRMIPSGTMVIRDGRILSVSAGGDVPAGARIIDLKGFRIYPAFIDAYVPQPEGEQSEASGRRSRGGPVYEVPRSGGEHWNPAVKAEFLAADRVHEDAQLRKKYMGGGFATVNLVPADGIFRGRSAVVDLGPERPSEAIIRAEGPQYLSFSAGRSELEYPRSKMGAIALIRQVLSDRDWLREAAEKGLDILLKDAEYNRALEALMQQSEEGGSFCMVTANELDLFRFASLAEEFGLNYHFRGSSYEYRRADAVKALGRPIILPLDFPEAPVPDAGSDLNSLSLTEMKHWDLAPSNAVLLSSGGLKTAFTADGLKDPAQIFERGRRMLERGLSEDALLAGLTLIPAELLGLKDRGALREGYAANFIVSDGALWDRESQLRSVWVRGREFAQIEAGRYRLPGIWTMEDSSAVLEIRGSGKGLDGCLILGADSLKLLTPKLSFNTLTALYEPSDAGRGRLQATLGGELLDLSLAGPGGEKEYFRLRRTGNPMEPAVEDVKEDTLIEYIEAAVYPENAFGWKQLPEAGGRVLIRGAEIWTMGPAGVLRGQDILIRDGKIHRIAAGIAVSDADRVIEAAGKTVTPGIIDAHAHIGIEGGVNEGTEANTAETRIGDVIYSDDPIIYRQLAGGVTACLALHGSANPIGALNQPIKLKWGFLPEDMKIRDARYGTIKFALGENVKQSNWGDDYTVRYPQTRMGVEAFIRDALLRARAYAEEQKAYAELPRRKQKNLLSPRRDIELEHMAAVLDGRIRIHCHSYVQSEIQMMTRLAGEFGLREGTFVHVLEGYKVADHIREAGWYATTFTDWWAYKFEVYDAIPYNPVLMHEQGVLVSVNSDDFEMGRRLNQEAAKVLKYGDLDAQEAFKMITVNAAKQLFIDHRTGSLEQGKDADLVIWSGNPLHPESRAEQTWIEGIRYFDIEEDAAMRRERDEIKAKLLTRILEEGGKKGPKAGTGGTEK